MDAYRKLNREHAELEPLVALYNNYRQAQSDIVEAQEMLNDPDMKEFAQEEIQAGKQRIEDLQRKLQNHVVAERS